MEIKLGFSPCPNDTFIFYALLHREVDTRGFHFEPTITDVEDLNMMSLEGILDMTKLSYQMLGHVLPAYQALRSGSALGFGCGPLLISHRAIKPEAVADCRIAIPGVHTTANLLLSLAFPDARNRVPYLFSEIEDAVLSGEVDCGVIIHENRFTYEARGLRKILDLGAWWESEHHRPIPLGCIACRREYPREVQEALDQVMRDSTAFALEHPERPLAFMRAHAAAMEERVMYEHVKLYVNEFTLDVGIRGKQAVNELFAQGIESGILPRYEGEIFIN